MTEHDPNLAPQAILAAGIVQHQQTIDACLATLAQPFASMIEGCEKAIAAGGKIVLFGNRGQRGGRAAYRGRVDDPLRCEPPRHRRAGVDDRHLGAHRLRQ